MATPTPDRCLAALRLLQHQGLRPARARSGGILSKAYGHTAESIRSRRARRTVASLTREFDRRRVTHVVVDAPTFHGSFELKADSLLALAVMAGRFEASATAVIATLVTEGRDAVDVGANAGLFSVYLASLVGRKGRVLAVEPSPAILHSLHLNLRRNGASNVLVYEGVLAESSGTRAFHSVDGSPEYSSIAAIVHPHAPTTVTRITVCSATLDELVAKEGLDPVLIKIDVEGAEPLVLTGGRHTLERSRPAVLAEADDRLLAQFGRTTNDIVEWFHSIDFRVYDMENGDVRRPEDRRPFIGSILALPAEAVARDDGQSA